MRRVVAPPEIRHRSPARILTAYALTVLLLVSVISLMWSGRYRPLRIASSERPEKSTAASQKSAATAAPKPTAAPTATPDPAIAAKAKADAAAATANNSLSAIMAQNDGIDVSVSALNVASGLTFNFGSNGAMVEGSTVKVDFLLTGILRVGGPLTGSQDDYATAMIENSDNDATDSMLSWLGGDSTVAAANQTFGLTSTNVGTGYLWGTGTTSAADQVLLFKQLVTPGAIPASGQAYALNLLNNVEADQRWGVGAAADANTTFANKNGWLSLDDDNNLWLVNSSGIVTYHGQQVILSVLTQHNDGLQSGTDLTESLAKAAVGAVVP